MKQDAANHWKIKALGKSLAERLAGTSLGGGALTDELSRRLAMGVMESLWIWAKRYYPRGDIGRASDEVIAIESGWDPKDAAWFVSTLVQLKLVDAHSRHRLIVHDMSEHAEDYVRKTLERAGIRTFIDGRPVRRDAVGRPRKPSAAGSRRKLDNGEPPGSDRQTGSPPDLAKPSQANPSQPSPSQPSQAAPPPAGSAIPTRSEILRGRGGSKPRDAGIGSALAAAGRPEHRTIVQALEVYWPPAKGRQAEELASHPNATLERVFWLIQRAEREPMRKGAAGKPGFIRDGIEQGWDVWPEWLAEQAQRLEQHRMAGATA